MPLLFQCIICKKSLPAEGAQEHSLDPCALILVAHANREWRDQKEQTFSCHFECFRRMTADDSVLYISGADYSTNGEVEDERNKKEPN